MYQNRVLMTTTEIRKRGGNIYAILHRFIKVNPYSDPRDLGFLCFPSPKMDLEVNVKLFEAVGRSRLLTWVRFRMDHSVHMGHDPVSYLTAHEYVYVLLVELRILSTSAGICVRNRHRRDVTCGFPGQKLESTSATNKSDSSAGNHLQDAFKQVDVSVVPANPWGNKNVWHRRQNHSSDSRCQAKSSSVQMVSLNPYAKEFIPVCAWLSIERVSTLTECLQAAWY